MSPLRGSGIVSRDRFLGLTPQATLGRPSGARNRHPLRASEPHPVPNPGAPPMSEIGPNGSPCEPGSGCCPPGPSRREFLQIVGLGAAGAIAGGIGPGRTVAAGPFESSDFETLVPRDKKLNPAWVRSLTERGEPAAYRGAELETIGMPVGGIGAGQVYLGGDGTLWHWDVFNRLRPTGDANYAHPPKPDAPLRQGFAIRVTRDGGKGEVRPIDHRGFPEITFAASTHRSRRVPRRGAAGRGHARSLLPLHPAQCRRFQPSGHDPRLHREEHGHRPGRGRTRRLAGERRLPRHRRRVAPPPAQSHPPPPRADLPGMLGRGAPRGRGPGPAQGHRLR